MEAEENLKRAARRLACARRDLAQVQKRGDQKKAELLRRVEVLEERPTELQTYQERGEVPPLVFGGIRLWKKGCKGRASCEEWRAFYKNRILSYGDSKYRSNPNFKLHNDPRITRVGGFPRRRVWMNCPRSSTC